MLSSAVILESFKLIQLNYFSNKLQTNQRHPLDKLNK